MLNIAGGILLTVSILIALLMSVGLIVMGVSLQIRRLSMRPVKIARQPATSTGAWRQN